MRLSQNYKAYSIKLTNVIFQDFFKDANTIAKYLYLTKNNDYHRSQTIIDTLTIDQKIYKSHDIKTIEDLKLNEQQKSYFLQIYNQGFTGELMVSGVYISAKNIQDHVLFHNNIFSTLKLDKNGDAKLLRYCIIKKGSEDQGKKISGIILNPQALVKIEIPLNVPQSSNLTGTMTVVSVQNTDITRKIVQQLSDNKDINGKKFKDKKFTDIKVLDHEKTTAELKAEIECHIKNLEISNSNVGNSGVSTTTSDQNSSKLSILATCNTSTIHSIIYSKPIQWICFPFVAIISAISWIYHEIMGHNTINADIRSQDLMKTFNASYSIIERMEEIEKRKI